MPTEKIYATSPNRNLPVMSQTTIEIISNFVDKISNYDVKFQNNLVILTTERVGRALDLVAIQNDMNREMDQVIKLIIEEIATYKVDVKIEKLSSQFDNIGWNQIMYRLEGVYSLEVKV